MESKRKPDGTRPVSVKSGVEELPKQDTIEVVAVVSVYPSRLKYRGSVSGKAYEWSDAGAVVMVDRRDVSYLLEKRIGNRGCCGANQNGNKLFELL